MIAASFEILTVGFPFCAFKLITGVSLSQDWLTAWGLVDTLLNTLNLGWLLFARRRLTDICLLSLLVRLMRRPAAEQVGRWQDLGAAGDMFFSLFNRGLYARWRISARVAGMATGALESVSHSERTGRRVDAVA
jgi:hypothetical protein